MNDIVSYYTIGSDLKLIFEGMWRITVGHIRPSYEPYTLINLNVNHLL